MSLLPRRLTFQLTPLLDLLLIVIFAQYMEVRQRSAEVEQNVRQESGERVARLEERLDAEQQQRQQLQKKAVALQAALAESRERQERIGDLLAKLFRVPENVVQEVTGAAVPDGESRQSEQRQQLEAALRELSQKRGREIVEQLLTYQELRKRCDVWELYIRDNGVVVFDTGRRTGTLRDYETSAGFREEFLEQYEPPPRQKSLVIVLVSYGDCRFVLRRAVLDALPKLVHKLQAESGGRTRYEFANLGYRPQAADRSVK